MSLQPSYLWSWQPCGSPVPVFGGYHLNYLTVIIGAVTIGVGAGCKVHITSGFRQDIDGDGTIGVSVPETNHLTIGYLVQ